MSFGTSGLVGEDRRTGSDMSAALDGWRGRRVFRFVEVPPPPPRPPRRPPPLLGLFPPPRRPPPLPAARTRTTLAVADISAAERLPPLGSAAPHARKQVDGARAPRLTPPTANETRALVLQLNITHITTLQGLSGQIIATFHLIYAESLEYHVRLTFVTRSKILTATVLKLLVHLYLVCARF